MAHGQLERLQVHAYKTAERQASDEVGVFEAFVNPAEYTRSYEAEYSTPQGAGTTGQQQRFQRIKPGDLQLSFFLDGTGANGRPLDVQAKVDDFMAITGFNGAIHEPNHLIVAWGRIEVRRCVLKSASIAYKLFRPDGTPLRAVISATFSESIDEATRVATEQKESPDLTHVRVLAAGQTLPMLCHAIYGDVTRAPAVARANGLDGFRGLPAGTRLRFPPLER